LIYTKFVTLSQSVRPLVAELEHRSSVNPDELRALLTECHSAYISTRQSLLGARVSDEVGRLDPRNSDLVDLVCFPLVAGLTVRPEPDAATSSKHAWTNSTCTSISFSLASPSYSTSTLLVVTTLLTCSGFLETLCDHLYDHLRPRILHEPSLETLCGVCTVLQALMVQDVSLDGGEDDDTIIISPTSTPGLSPYNRDTEDYFGRRGSFRQNSISMSRQYSGSGSIMTRKDSSGPTPGGHHRLRRPLSRLHTEVLLKMVLQDAQTRLVFRAQALIQADVQYYAPRDGDLDYPEKLGTGMSYSCGSADVQVWKVEPWCLNQIQRYSMMTRTMRSCFPYHPRKLRRLGTPP
jgi:hypothetical protein